MNQDSQRMWKLAGRYSGLGIEMVASVVFGALIGRWLDQKLGTAPYLMWFWIAAGFGAAILAVLRVIKSFKKMH